MSIDSDVIRGHVDTIILKTLTTGDKYGYEIIKEIEQKSQGTYELKQPTLYSCLKRLENQGLISGFTKNSDIGGKRHYYKLTKKGRETYENSMQEWFNSRSIIDSLMGSKPTNFTSAGDEEHFSPTELDKDLEDEYNQTEQILEESMTESEESQSTQMVLDDQTNITEETEPRNFENNLEDDDVQLLGDYYQTDENQIDLFGDSEPHWTETFSETSDSTVQSEPDEFISNMFKNYDGTDVNKYKQNNKTNYYESISYGVVDEDNIDVHHEAEELFEEDDTSIEDEPQEVVKNESSSPFSSFSFFTSYPEEDEETETSYDNHSTDNEEYIDKENEPEEDNDSSLSFGFGYTNDTSDEMDFPTSFEDIEEDDDLNSPSQPLESHISIFGEETPDLDESESYEKPYYTEEPSYVNYEPFEPAELKPFNIGNYTEPEYKEKLNQLSSYTKSNYETKPTGYVKNENIIESRSIEELRDELGQSGIEVRTYAKPEQVAQKDKKYLLVNKIKFTTSWIVSLIMTLLLGGAYLIANSVGYLDFKYIETALPPYVFFIIAELAVLVVPAIYSIIYLINKTKKVKPNYNALISFVFAMLFFIVCLNIIYTLNILNGFTKFTQIDYNHLLWLLPSVVSLLIIFQSLVYSLLYKTKKFNA